MITCRTCRRTSKPVIIKLRKPLIKCGLCNSTNVRKARADEVATVVKKVDVGLKLFSV